MNKYLPKGFKVVIAGFSVDYEKSIFYRSYKTTTGAALCFKKLVESMNVDYISVRVINRKNPVIRTALDLFLEEQQTEET